MDIGLLPVPEVELYYSTAFSRAGINATADIIKQAAISTKGFPYLVQLMGYYLSKLSEGGKPIDASALAQAENLAGDEVGSKVFQAMINPLSDNDLNFLKAIAQHSGTSKIAVLEKRMGISRGTAQTYRKRLMDAGIIFAPRRGELALVMPQLAEYLRRIDT